METSLLGMMHEVKPEGSLGSAMIPTCSYESPFGEELTNNKDGSNNGCYSFSIQGLPMHQSLPDT